MLEMEKKKKTTEMKGWPEVGQGIEAREILMIELRVKRLRPVGNTCRALKKTDTNTCVRKGSNSQPGRNSPHRGILGFQGGQSGPQIVINISPRIPELATKIQSQVSP